MTDREELFSWMESHIDMGAILENHMVNTLGWHYAVLTTLSEWIHKNNHATDYHITMARNSYRMIQESKDRLQTNGWAGSW